MKFLENISDFVGKRMAVIVLIVGVIALFSPNTLSWIKTSWINNLLAIVMFGMGLTLKSSDFQVVFLRPKDLAIGCTAQFAIMPLIAFVLTKVFNLPLELAIGVILVGTCPGGTSSNVMTYLAKGDVALSVAMTSVSTLLAPVLTPALTLLYAGHRVDVNVAGMFLSIIKIVIIPIVLGLIISKILGKITAQLTKILPLVSVVAIVMIVASVVAANFARILSSGLLVVTIVILHNLLGYATGYAVGFFIKMPESKRNAIAIEVGMQNSGLATSLAVAHFAQYPLAAIPGAIFSMWHNISGSVVANIMAARYGRKPVGEDQS